MDVPQVDWKPRGLSKRAVVGGGTLFGLLLGIGLVMFLGSPSGMLPPTGNEPTGTTATTTTTPVVPQAPISARTQTPTSTSESVVQRQSTQQTTTQSRSLKETSEKFRTQPETPSAQRPKPEQVEAPGNTPHSNKKSAQFRCRRTAEVATRAGQGGGRTQPADQSHSARGGAAETDSTRNSRQTCHHQPTTAAKAEPTTATSGQAKTNSSQTHPKTNGSGPYTEQGATCSPGKLDSATGNTQTQTGATPTFARYSSEYAKTVTENQRQTEPDIAAIFEAITNPVQSTGAQTPVTPTPPKPATPQQSRPSAPPLVAPTKNQPTEKSPAIHQNQPER